MVRKTRKLTRMGRRRFLGTLSAMGLSTEAVSYMSKDKLEELTEDPTEEVPRIRSLEYPNQGDYQEPPYPEEPDEREAEYYTISRDKWIVVESAFDAAKQVQKRIDNLDDTGLVSAGVAINRSNNVDDYSIVVKRNEILPHSKNIQQGDRNEFSTNDQNVSQTPNITLDELMGELPDTAEGSAGDGVVEATVRDSKTTTRDNIPIEFEESVTYNEAYSDEPCQVTDYSDERFFTGQYRYYAGHDYHTGTGCEINVDPDGYNGVLTLGPRVQPNSGGSPMMMTSAHGTFVGESEADDDDDADAEDPQEAIGREVYQGVISDFYKIGDVSEIRHHNGDAAYRWDVALIEMSRPDDEIYAGNRLASDDHINGFSGELSSSRVGKDYIKDKEGNVGKQGIRTGRCEHVIRDYIPGSGSTPDEIELHRDNEHGDGNSGSPYFADVDGSLKVAGMHNWGTTLAVNTHIATGLWIGDIEEEFNVQVV